MFVIERDGKDRSHHWMACGGHRGGSGRLTTAVLAALAFLVLGVAVIMIVFLLIVIPAVAIVALVGWSFQPRRT